MIRLYVYVYCIHCNLVIFALDVFVFVIFGVHLSSKYFCKHSAQSLNNNNLVIFVLKFSVCNFVRPNVRKLRGHSVVCKSLEVYIAAKLQSAFHIYNSLFCNFCIIFCCSKTIFVVVMWHFCTIFMEVWKNKTLLWVSIELCRKA